MILSDLLCESFGQRLVELGETFGNGYRTVVFDEAVRAVSDADHFAFNAHGIFELELHCTHFADVDIDFNDILESGGMFIFTGNRNDGREDVFRLDFIETEAQLVEPVDPSLFHETDIVGVMRHTHAVAFVVFHLVFVGVHRSAALFERSDKNREKSWNLWFRLKEFVFLRLL